MDYIEQILNETDDAKINSLLVTHYIPLLKQLPTHVGSETKFLSSIQLIPIFKHLYTKPQSLKTLFETVQLTQPKSPQLLLHLFKDVFLHLGTQTDYQWLIYTMIVQISKSNLSLLTEILDDLLILACKNENLYTIFQIIGETVSTVGINAVKKLESNKNMLIQYFQKCKSTNRTIIILMLHRIVKIDYNFVIDFVKLLIPDLKNTQYIVPICDIFEVVAVHKPQVLEPYLEDLKKVLLINTVHNVDLSLAIIFIRVASKISKIDIASDLIKFLVQYTEGHVRSREKISYFANLFYQLSRPELFKPHLETLKKLSLLLTSDVHATNCIAKILELNGVAFKEESEKITFFIKFENDIQALEFQTDANIEYQSLQEKVDEHLKKLNAKLVSMYFVDDEEEKIAIKSNDDLQYVLECSNENKIELNAKSEKNEGQRSENQKTENKQITETKQVVSENKEPFFLNQQLQGIGLQQSKTTSSLQVELSGLSSDYVPDSGIFFGANMSLQKIVKLAGSAGVSSYLGMHNGATSIIKEYFVSCNKELAIEVAKVIQNLQKLNLSNVIRIISFQITESSVTLVLQQCNPFTYMAATPFNELALRLIAKSLLTSLNQLHTNNIIQGIFAHHTVYSDMSGTYMLGDSGVLPALSSFVPSLTMMKLLLPGLVFVAPEVLNEGKFSKESDIWSLGCLLIGMHLAKSPYTLDTSKNIQDQVSDMIKNTQQPPPIPTGFSQDGTDFLKKCLVVDPKQRATSEQLLKHTWLANL